jgi:ABC-type Fe3+ transport system substrate-binding protein
MSNPSEWQQFIDGLFTPAEQEAFRATGSFEVKDNSNVEQPETVASRSAEQDQEPDEDENPLNFIQRFYDNLRD